MSATTAIRTAPPMQAANPDGPALAKPAQGVNTEEQALIKAAIGGDTRAFESLYRSHVGRVRGLVWRMTGGHAALTDDLTQDAFVRAWQKLDTFRGASAFGTWLHRITVNVVLGDRRSRLRKAESELDDAALAECAIPDDAPNHAAHPELEMAIAALPQRARLVLVLFSIYGYTHVEISDMSGMAVGTSKAHLHRARQLLQERMNP